jgi:hypothetical protein
MVDKNDNEQIVFVIALIAMMLILPLFLYLMASMYFDMLQNSRKTRNSKQLFAALSFNWRIKNDTHSRIPSR